VDTKQKRLIAVAMGTPEMRTRELTIQVQSDQVLQKMAADSCDIEPEKMIAIAKTRVYSVFQASKTKKKFFGLFTTESFPVRVLDKEGVIRLKLKNAVVRAGTVSTSYGLLGDLIEELTVFGDAGGLHPDVFCVVSARIMDLSGLINKEQILSLLRAELERFSIDEIAIVIVSCK